MLSAWCATIAKVCATVALQMQAAISGGSISTTHQSASSLDSRLEQMAQEGWSGRVRLQHLSQVCAKSDENGKVMSALARRCLHANLAPRTDEKERKVYTG